MASNKALRPASRASLYGAAAELLKHALQRQLAEAGAPAQDQSSPPSSLDEGGGAIAPLAKGFLLVFQAEALDSSGKKQQRLVELCTERRPTAGEHKPHEHPKNVLQFVLTWSIWL